MSWDNSSWLVASKIVETWSVKLRLPTKKVKPTLMLYFSFMLTISALFYILSEINTTGLPVPGFVFAIVLVLVFFMTTLASLTVTAASAQDSTVMAWWRCTPVSDRKLGLGFSVTAWVVALSQILLTLPVVFSIFRTTIPPATLIVAYVFTVIVGTITGRFLFVVSGFLLTKISKQLVAHAQAFGTLLWVFQFGFCVFLLQNVFFAGETQNYFWLKFLGYPILFLVNLQTSVVFFVWFFCGLL